MVLVEQTVYLSSKGVDERFRVTLPVPRLSAVSCLAESC
jgi:hypothetical protein